MGVLVVPFTLLAGGIAVIGVAWVAAGVGGFIALQSVVRWLFDGLRDPLDPRLVRILTFFGILAMLPFAVFGDIPLLGVLPLISTVHICYLARAYVFAATKANIPDVPAA